MKERDKEKQRNCTSALRINPYNTSSIPARFKRMDPERPKLHSLVSIVSKAKGEEKINHKSLKSFVRSLLSPENRVWRKEQIAQNNRRAAQLLRMGGKPFLVSDEGKVEPVKQDESPTKNILKKQDSTESNASDWSDEERDELEKQFRGMVNRSNMLKAETLIKNT